MPGLRERKKSRTRHDLMTAALRLCGERGFDDVTVDEIAAVAGVSPRTFFRYYDSKADAIFGEAPERLAALRHALAERSPGTPLVETVRAVFVAAAEEFVREKGVYLVRAKLMTTEPAVAARWLRLLAEVEQAIAEAEARELGRSPAATFRARLRAGIMMSALKAGAYAWAASDGKVDLTRLVSEGLDVVGRLDGTASARGQAAAARRARNGG